jgi:cell division inhibitor SulA
MTCVKKDDPHPILWFSSSTNAMERNTKSNHEATLFITILVYSPPDSPTLVPCLLLLLPLLRPENAA